MTGAEARATLDVDGVEVTGTGAVVGFSTSGSTFGSTLTSSFTGSTSLTFSVFTSSLAGSSFG